MELALDDAGLVGAALAGDRDAFAAIYDRYADTVFTVCAHMLGNRTDAADATSDVFLAAAERLGTLRDPSRLRPWLLAIARHNVYRRSSRRTRTVPVAEVDDMSGPLLMDDGADSPVDQSELAAVLGAAAAGLDDGDRMVLELQLQGLDGADLADALGVGPDAAYQATFRMKQRLERSIGALLVARQGRAECADLDSVLAGWDGTFSVLWRKRVARHVDSCDVCERRKKAVPALLLGGVAGATTLLAAPTALRDEVLGSARIGGPTPPPWRADGFPPGPARVGRRAALALLAALLVVAALAAGLVRSCDPAPASPARPSPSTTTSPSTLVATTVPTTVPTTLPTTVAPPPSTSSVPATTSAPSKSTTTMPAGRPSTSVPRTTVPPTTVPPTTTSTTTTTPRPTSPPNTIIRFPTTTAVQVTTTTTTIVLF